MATAFAGILLCAFRAEDGDRDRLALRDIVALDPLGHIVAQPDRFGALDERAFGARFHQREAATALPEEIRCARSVGEQRARAGHEDQAGLVKTCRSGPWPDAHHVAKRTRDL